MGIIKALSATRLTKSDMVFLMLKFSLLVFLCVQTSILFGLPAALITFFLIEKMIQVSFGVEPLNATDKNVFYDQETNRCHIIGKSRDEGVFRPHAEIAEPASQAVSSLP